MFTYPKIPRYGLDFIDDDFWNEELIATEKVDGALFRFTVYDSRYADAFGVNDPPTDGTIIAGTSNHTRWRITPDGNITGEEIGEYEPTLRRLAKIDCDAVLTLYDEYGPLVFFGEAMVGHLIEYENTPPFLGFDVYAPFTADRETIATPNTDENPYTRTFEGFLPTEEAFETFETIGVPTIHESGTAPRVGGRGINPDELTIPSSQFGDVQAEGIVFRNSGTDQRVKVRSEFFEEVKEHYHDYDDNSNADPTERFIAEYCTPTRIMKIVQKMAVEENRELSRNLIEPARHRVYDDIWEEEWRTIKELSYPVNPANIKNRVAKKTANVVDTMVEHESQFAINPKEESSKIEFE